ncbi:MAG: acetoin utilization protein AcuC [Deltaproteobacteria bacterium]|nr:acetoin utilization protein AcuC [Deltaproteobacteria bacterium]
MKTTFLYSEKFANVSYGRDHPMRPMRLKLTYELIKECGLFDIPGAKIVEARKATEEELLLFHTPQYIEMLKKADSGALPEDAGLYGLGDRDNPAFPGVFEWSCYSTGASIQAAELISEGKADIAFNIAGGLHHARSNGASGFCYLNDPAVAINHLLTLGKRVAYVDIDAHHADGVEAAFYDTDKVLTISIHESGRYLFPGTGFPQDMGEGSGRGYAINLPLPPSAGDELFLLGFEGLVPPFIEAFKPDMLVTQLGVDTFKKDPISHLSLTTNGFEKMVKGFKSFNLPWAALGGGGYDLDNVKRAWTLSWAIMNGVKAPARLRDGPLKDETGQEGRRNVVKDIDFLKREALPLVKKAGYDGVLP